jgi:squalene-associated FAD-dependent desaturase
VKEVIVVGGGFAGLAAAAHLVDHGARVTLIEKRPQLGGRACSFVDETTGDRIDNGQHLLLGCYRATRAFLERVGAAGELRLQDRLRVAFVDGESGKLSQLRASPLPPPLDLLGGLAGFGALGWRDKLSALRVATAVQLPSRLQPPATDWETVDAWLDRHGQSAAARRAFYHPLALATLNDDPATASARLFEGVLREALFGPGADARLALPRRSLAELYVEPAQAWLAARGAIVRADAAVARVIVEGGVARGVELKDGERLRADAVIAAVPPPALLALVDPELRRDVPWWGGIERLQPSPIVSLHLWLDRVVTDEEVIGVVDSPLHWIFGNQRRLSLVVSAARALVDEPAHQIVERLVGEVRRLLPAAARAEVVHSRVIKERAATIAHTAGSEGLRPRVQSPIAGLFVAADYVRTGLPATIESAVRAADEAAALVLDYRAPRVAAPAAGGSFVPVTSLARLTRAQPPSPSSSPAPPPLSPRLPPSPSSSSEPGTRSPPSTGKPAS